MKKYFFNPFVSNFSEFIEQLTQLNDNVSQYIRNDVARVPSSITENYASLLSKENLSEYGEDLESIYSKLAYYSQGLIRWNHPGALINVNPPATIPSTVVSSYFSLFSPNGAQDMSTGYLLTTELAVVKMLSQLADIDYKQSGGYFTFGGKSTNIHAIKHGLQRISKDYGTNGIKDDIVTFSSTQGHPCHAEACNWLGIGDKNCIRIPTNKMGEINLEELEKSLAESVEQGKKIACITVNGGTTIQMTIDPIKKVVDIRNRLVKKYNLEYVPRVHVDSVIGWVWLFFKTYNFTENPLNFSDKALQKLQRQMQRISDIKYADSFGVDFHKTGFAPYLSSVYITKDKTELFEQNHYKGIPYDELEYGNYSPFQYTLELSRPLNGALAAYVNLKSFGVQGFQKIIGGLMEASEYLKDLLTDTKRFEIINNEDSDGFVTLFVAKEAINSPSFFDLGNLHPDIIEQFGQYNYKFYLFLLEKQKKGECWFAIDYSTGYHRLSNGKKLGVLKAYPMTPYFDRYAVEKLTEDLVRFQKEFDKVKETFVVKEVPHKPRPFVYK